MDSSRSILVVDDNRDLLELIRRQLNAIGVNPFISDNVIDAIEILDNTKIDLLITDMNMPNISGDQLVRYASEHHPGLPTLVITGYPNVDSAVHVMKLGAIEYLIKPFTEEELYKVIAKILPKKETEVATKVVEKKRDSFMGIIGASESMQQLYDTIERTKSNKATVLISGESGTGKELVARAIHYNSDYSSAPFVPVNCGAIPEQLIESELFGHIKGSFTGAISNRAGFFQAANGGTIFLDEISNTSLELQAKLLRVIQDKQVTALGSEKSQQIDVRILAATNVNIWDLISQGKFREDLYYRLNVISINIPPLRARSGDINKLIHFFSKKFCRDLGKKKLVFAKGVLNTLEKYAWPGNVREMENFIQRIVIMTDGEVTMNDIPEYMKMKIDQTESDQNFLTLEEYEKKYIRKVLVAVGNNKSEAARILNIDRKTLRDKLK
ncbi:MAG: sigma-54 dependent transcriptional regulator [Crocinitomicaceae bacterium]